MMDEGSYHFALWIESDDASATVKLYQDAQLLDEGRKVKAESWFFVYSFNHFLAILGLALNGIIGTGISIAALYYKLKMKPLRDIQTAIEEARARDKKDLRAVMGFFCDTWEDHECITPYSDLRKDLVLQMNSIRELLSSAELSKSETNSIRNISKDFLRIANKFGPIDDSLWSEKVKDEMERVCKALRDAAMRMK
jgi:hypothetical protein